MSSYIPIALAFTKSASPTFSKTCRNNNNNIYAFMRVCNHDGRLFYISATNINFTAFKRGNIGSFISMYRGNTSWTFV